METNVENIYCDRLANKCINLEKDVVDYLKQHPNSNNFEELLALTNELNKIALRLKKISFKITTVEVLS